LALTGSVQRGGFHLFIPQAVNSTRDTQSGTHPLVPKGVFPIVELIFKKTKEKAT
jgi:hypothetical protein